VRKDLSFEENGRTGLCTSECARIPVIDIVSRRVARYMCRQRLKAKKDLYSGSFVGAFVARIGDGALRRNTPSDHARALRLGSVMLIAWMPQRRTRAMALKKGHDQSQPDRDASDAELAILRCRYYMARETAEAKRTRGPAAQAKIVLSRLGLPRRDAGDRVRGKRSQIALAPRFLAVSQAASCSAVSKRS